MTTNDTGKKKGQLDKNQYFRQSGEKCDKAKNSIRVGASITGQRNK